MPLRLRDISLELHDNESELPRKVAELLGVSSSDLSGFQVVRRSVDARRKPRVLRIFTVEFSCAQEQHLLTSAPCKGRLENVESVSFAQPVKVSPERHVVVVGMGPAGFFAALRLADAGVRVTLADMGDPVEKRVKRVEEFWGDGQLDPFSNVQFGEGGAGTFSDGKLSTRIKHAGIREVLRILVQFGADPLILEQAKPHVGTDRLRKVMVCFREYLQQRGVTFRYRTRLSGFETSAGRICSAQFDDHETLNCDALVLAPGHSATQTFEMLFDSGVSLEAKPFAMGIRVDHPAELINEIQYGLRRHKNLPTADYALAYNDKRTGRGIYSFCMCPGGEVINASSEAQGVVVNGMSHRRRDGERSNSALVVSVREDDFFESSPLDGLYFQRHWEQQAFKAAGSNFQVPVENMMSFLGDSYSAATAVCPPGVCDVPLNTVLPAFVAEGIKTALPLFNSKMRGFVTSEANLFGVETRTSSPVRIIRNLQGESSSHPGLFPAGEGAGYAGGIMSAALDGMKTADAVLAKFQE